MRWIENLAIKRKLMLVIMSGTVAALLLTYGGFLAVHVITFRAHLAQEMTVMADLIGGNSTAAIVFDDAQTARENLAALGYEPHVISAYLYTAQGSVFASYRKEGSAEMIAPAPQPPGHRFARRVFEIFQPIRLDNETIGTVYIRRDMQDLRDQNARYIGILALVLIAACLVVFLLSFGLQRLISEPILRLVRATGQVTLEQDYSVRVDRKTEDELGLLTDGFNRMLEQIQERDQALQKARLDLEARVKERTGELEEEITERRRSEDELKASELKFRQLAQHISEIFWIANADGSEILYVSPAYEQVWGHPAEYLYRHPESWTDLIHPDDRDRVRQAFARLSAGEEMNETYRIQRDDRSIRWIRDRGFAVANEHGQIYRRVGIAEDITEHREAQERERDLQVRLARSARLESVGLLAGGVAHDLNNILGPLVGYPDLILEILPADSPIREDVQEIGDSARRAAAVIQDLLTLARRSSYQLEPLLLNDILRGYLKSASYRELSARFPHVRSDSKLDDSLLPILGSAPHLTQVIMNLVINAFEAMPHGGSLALSTSMLYLDVPVRGYDTIEQGDYVLLSVADSGGGIAREDLERIFEPFYTKKKMGRGGTGLGLAVVYGVVKDLKGYIDVKTELGQGAEFIIYFPVTHDTAGVQEPPAANLQGSEHILIVDDVAEQRQLAQRLLTRLGYRVDTVASGHAAMAFCRENPVDLIVLDMIMEDGFDGLETFRRILEFRPGQPCIIASGFAETERVRTALTLGVSRYVRKPYTQDKIARAVRETLDQAARGREDRGEGN